MICVSVDALDYDLCESLLPRHSFMEFRLDRTIMTIEEIKELFRNPNRLIATCRPGKFDIEKKEEILKATIESGARYVDIEYDNDSEFIARIKSYCGDGLCKLIISYHNSEETPDDETLTEIANKALNLGADIVKIAAMVKTDEDNIRLLALYRQFKPEQLVAFGMGAHGKITRITIPHLGAPFTYASLERNQETAPGQIDILNMKQIYKLMK